jgi:hypothetical protein
LLLRRYYDAVGFRLANDNRLLMRTNVLLLLLLLLLPNRCEITTRFRSFAVLLLLLLLMDSVSGCGWIAAWVGSLLVVILIATHLLMLVMMLLLLLLLLLLIVVLRLVDVVDSRRIVRS